MSKNASRKRADSEQRTFQAGCGKSWTLASAEADLAYTALEFPECPACPHRVEADGGGAFCTLRPETAPHPFAGLAQLKLPE